MAAAAWGASEDSAANLGAEGRWTAAMPGSGPDGGEPAGSGAPALAAFRGRPHCQQAADAGKLLAPQ